MKKESWVEKRECFNCDGIMHRNQSKISGVFVRGWKCRKCGEELIMGIDAQKAFVLNKMKKGTAVSLGKLGNSNIIRIPKKVYDVFGLKNKKELTLKVQLDNEKPRIILEF